MAEVANLNTRLSLESASFISGIEKSRGAVRSLIASLDPAAAAQAKFNRESQLLEGAMKRGQITAEAYAKGLDVLRQRMTAATVSGGAIVNSAGAQRAGFQQLSFQIGDIATQFGSGTKVMTIFAQQSGQVVQALGMMTNSTKGLLGFLGGPWGQIITAATVILAPFIAKLFQSADGADAATDSVMKYADALKTLQGQAGAFKFGSAEFKKVNEDFLVSQAKVVKLRQELASAGSNGPSIVTPGSTGGISASRSRESVQVDLARAIKDADKKRGDLSALILQSNSRADLDRSGPPPSNPHPNRDRRAKASPRDNFGDELGRLQVEGLRAYADLTGNIQKRYEADLAELTESTASFKRRIELDKGLDETKRASLVAEREKTDAIKRQAIEASRQEAQDREAFAFEKAGNEAAQEMVRFDLDSARTSGQRRDGQLRLLELQKRLEKAQLELVLATEKTGSEAYAKAQTDLGTIDQRYGMMQGQVRRDTMGPLESHLDKIPKTAAEINEAFQHVAADGIQSMTDGIAEAIAGSRSLADVFHNVANQIIADLIRIELQKAIAGGLSKALGSFTGSTGGSAGITTSHAGAGNVKSFASGGSMRIGGVPGVDRNVLSINGIPRAMVSHNENFTVGYGQQSNAARIEIVEHPGFASRVVGISGDVSIKTTRASNNAASRRGRARLA